MNIDESGISDIPKPRKIIASQGEKQVGKITAGERGEIVTACCAINAIGKSIHHSWFSHEKIGRNE